MRPIFVNSDYILYEHVLDAGSLVEVVHPTLGVTTADLNEIMILSKGGLVMYDSSGEVIIERVAPGTTRSATPREITEEVVFAGPTENGCTMYCASKRDKSLHATSTEFNAVADESISIPTPGLLLVALGSVNVDGAALNSPAAKLVTTSSVITSLDDSWSILIS